MARLTNIMTPKEIQALLLQPAGKPPSGVIANFADPPDLEVPVILTILFFITVAAFATWMRIYTKIFIIKALAYEDCGFGIIDVLPILTTARCNFSGMGEYNQFYLAQYTKGCQILLTANDIVVWVTLVHGGHGVHIWNLRLGTELKLLYARSFLVRCLRSSRLIAMVVD